MHRVAGVLALTVVATALSLVPAPAGVRSQVECEGEYESFSTACFIGTPDAQGVTLRSAIVSSRQWSRSTVS